MRRLFHHLTFYGFMLCFAATVVATFYHYALGWKAPYPGTSLPVALGVLEASALVAGPIGLMRFEPVAIPTSAIARRPASTTGSCSCCWRRVSPGSRCSPCARRRPWACSSRSTWAR